jgi:nicotinamidase-related amidase
MRMPVSAIEKAALVALDFQVATAALPSSPHPVSELVERTAALAVKFREQGLPVVWVTVGGGVRGRTQAPAAHGDLPDNWSDLLPELGRHPADHELTKYAWGAFHDDRLEKLLTGLGVEQVVLTGVTTSFAVESTARAAFERNYHVVVVSDAIGDLDADAHDNSVRRIFPNLGEVATTAEVLAKL